MVRIVEEAQDSEEREEPILSLRWRWSNNNTEVCKVSVTASS